MVVIMYIKSRDFGAWRSLVQSWVYRLLASFCDLCLLTSQNLSSFMCKMEKVIVLFGVVRTE